MFLDSFWSEMTSMKEKNNIFHILKKWSTFPQFLAVLTLKPILFIY